MGCIEIKKKIDPHLALSAAKCSPGSLTFGQHMVHADIHGIA